MQTPDTSLAARRLAIARIATGVCVIGILAYTYALGVENGDASLFDYFGYFTNLTSLLTALLLIASGALRLRGRTAPTPFALIRATAAACMIVVGVVYNLLVPGTGTAPAWVSAILHTVFPVCVVLDWAVDRLLVDRDRPALPWGRLWAVLSYPLLWLVVTLIRGATDGWVPYGFLLPERGPVSLTAHVVGLLTTLLLAGAAVWLLDRLRSVPAPRR